MDENSWTTVSANKYKKKIVVFINMLVPISFIIVPNFSD